MGMPANNMCHRAIVLICLTAYSLGAFLPPKGKPFFHSDGAEDSSRVLDTKLFFKKKCTNFTVHFKDNDSYVIENVHYFLYTRENWKPYLLTKNDTELLNKSTFNSSRPTRVLCHGFLNSFLSNMEQEILDAYLFNQDVNVVTVSWAKLAFTLLHYNRAVSYTKAVGKEIAQLIDFLVTKGGADIRSFHLIGHSLGAHVVAFASNYVTSGNITRISGLDPALPEFRCAALDSRLDPGDALRVDCIHTDGGMYGFYEPLCLLDFYPNGGTGVQPGCWSSRLIGFCSHNRSFRLFAASINITFESEFCESFEMMEKRNCSTSINGLMGEPSITSLPGVYYLETTGTVPYVKNSTLTKT